MMSEYIELQQTIANMLMEFNKKIMECENTNINEKIDTLDRLANQLEHFSMVVRMSIKDLAS